MDESIENIVDALEVKIKLVLQRHSALKEEHLKVTQELKQSQRTIDEQDLAISSWKEKYQSLKMANTILGSKGDKREAKLKINTLLRDLDHCISQLSK